MSDSLANPVDVPNNGPSEADSSARSWSTGRFIFILVFILAFHIALIVLFGAKKPVTARPVGNSPHLQLVTAPSEFIALDDPTLFARPNAQDVVSGYWRTLKPAPPPNFNYHEEPRYFPPANVNFGAVALPLPATQFPLDLKPAPAQFVPQLPADNDFPVATSMRISGDLAQRPLVHTVQLPELSRNDVIAPSTVQALVDTSGNVFSAVILQASQDTAADQLALYLVRGLQFKPAPRVTFGRVTFDWHTMPLIGTNQFQ